MDDDIDSFIKKSLIAMPSLILPRQQVVGSYSLLEADITPENAAQLWEKTLKFKPYVCNKPDSKEQQEYLSKLQNQLKLTKRMANTHNRKNIIMVENKTPAIFNNPFRVLTSFIIGKPLFHKKLIYQPTLKTLKMKTPSSENNVLYEQAISCFLESKYLNAIEKLERLKSKKLPHLQVWLALSYFYQHLIDKTKKSLITSESILIANPKNPQLLLMLLCVALKIQASSNKSLNKPEIYSQNIKSIDDYYGYLAYVMTISNSSPTQADSVLLDMIQFYPTKPEAYIKLWALYYQREQYHGAMEIAEKSFIYAIDYDSIETKLTLVYMYCVSLHKINKCISAFEFAQYNYTYYGISYFLYLYAKMVAKSDHKNYYCSAIGALEECLRQGSLEQISNYYYYLGYIHEKKKRIIQAVKMYSKSSIKKADLLKSKYKQLIGSISYIKSTLKTPSQYKKDVFNQHLEVINSTDPYYKNYYKAIGVRILEGKNEDSDIMLISLIKQYPNKVRAYLKYAHFSAADPTENYYTISDSVYHHISSKAQDYITPKQFIKVCIAHSKSLLRRNHISDSIACLKPLICLIPPIASSDFHNLALDIDVANLNSPFDNANDVENELESEFCRRNSCLKYKGNFGYNIKEPIYNQPVYSESMGGHEKLNASFSFKPEYSAAVKIAASEDFGVCSDPIFLYKLGKLHIVYGKPLEGINYLKDYATLILSLPDNNDNNELNELKAYYYIASGLSKINKEYTNN